MSKEKSRKNNSASSKDSGNLKLQFNNKCEVEIFGHRYTLCSDSDDAYTRQLAALVDQKMTELAGKTNGVELSKLAVFTAVNIAHELLQLKKQQKETDAVISRKTRGLIESIEEQFEEFRP